MKKKNELGVNELGVKYVIYKIDEISHSLIDDPSKENMFWKWNAIRLLLSTKDWIDIIANQIPKYWRDRLDVACSIVLPYNDEFKARQKKIENRLKGYGIELD